jgi:hypothetical protein
LKNASIVNIVGVAVAAHVSKDYGIKAVLKKFVAITVN